jgi:hypothetical protein
LASPTTISTPCTAPHLLKPPDLSKHPNHVQRDEAVVWQRRPARELRIAFVCGQHALNNAAEFVLVQVLQRSRVRAVCNAPDGAGLQRREAHDSPLRELLHHAEGALLVKPPDPAEHLHTSMNIPGVAGKTELPLSPSVSHAQCCGAYFVHRSRRTFYTMLVWSDEAVSKSHISAMHFKSL